MTNKSPIAPPRREDSRRQLVALTDMGHATTNPLSPDWRRWLALAALSRGRVAAYIRCTTHDSREVDELLSEVWANAWYDYTANRQHLPEENRLISHARVACARLKSLHRHEVALSAADLASLAYESPAPSQNRRYQAFCRACDAASQLPQQQYYAIVFRELRGATFNEVARALGCSVSAAKTHYWRGITTLRGRLGMVRI